MCMCKYSVPLLKHDNIVEVRVYDSSVYRGMAVLYVLTMDGVDVIRRAPVYFPNLFNTYCHCCGRML